MTGLAALVFALGLRHGFDPDHLVAIDGMTRATRSRWCGLYFSLGHGAAITLIGVAVALAASRWQAPLWLEPAGAAVSIAVLVALGCANLAALARSSPGAPARLVGLHAGWMAARLARARHPALIAAVGAAFALSLDTVSHAAAFSLSGAAMSGTLFAALLGGVFTLGMLITDALNGLWAARMMTSADRHAAARWMSAAVACLCFATAAAGALKHLAPGAGAAALPLSVGSVALLGALAAFAVLRSRSAYRETGS